MNVRYELELRERIVRVEEELKHQRELMFEGFKQMEKCFEQGNYSAHFVIPSNARNLGFWEY